MKKVVLTFGLISAVILSAELFITMVLVSNGTLDHSVVLGYSTMLLALLMVFFGIRSYRDNVNGGTITFWKGVQVGLLISLFACAGYVISWEIYYYNWGGDFIAHYTSHVLAKLRASGASDAEIAAKTVEMADFAKLYANPVINVLFTFLEVIPVGLIVTLVSAAILRRASAGGDTAQTVAA
ncbi:MAG TPA: DUF4199 domain-containing protein [Thermoanaerobaculia bacterium]|nr:DUF4199 domain-containing protein [Thermoanaerobaculia bacterium]